MKKNTLILALLSSFTLSAQVGIGTTTPDESTSLDIVSSTKGVLLPKVALTSLNSTDPIANAVQGIMVYNTTDNGVLDPGYYFWNGTQWKTTGESNRTTVVNDSESSFILGYTPSGAHPAINSTTSIEGKTLTNKRCVQWTTGTGANNHWYCAYNVASGGVTWPQAFQVGKNLGGYLVTITSNEEWDVVRNLYQNSDINSGHIWIGNAKVINPAFDVNTPSQGINTEFRWITGEVSNRSWSNSTTIQQNFKSGEPNNADKKEGCSHIIAKESDSANQYYWNDDSCDRVMMAVGGKNSYFNVVIVEFLQ